MSFYSTQNPTMLLSKPLQVHSGFGKTTESKTVRNMSDIYEAVGKIAQNGWSSMARLVLDTDVLINFLRGKIQLSSTFHI